LERLVEVCDVAGVVVPSDSSAKALWQMAAARNIPLLEISELPEADLFCVATFPKILDDSVLARPRLGVLNVHPSLLPRHRGPDPLFWTYFNDESETGVTVHWMNDKADAGDIVLQKRVPIERGTAGMSLYMKLATIGAELLSEAVVGITKGNATRTPQDEQSATTDPPPSKMTWRIPYDEWKSERLFHFLRGVVHLGLPPFAGARSVRRFDVTAHAEAPGTSKRHGKDLIIYTRDGLVRLRMASPSLPSRIRRWLHLNLRM